MDKCLDRMWRLEGGSGDKLVRYGSSHRPKGMETGRDGNKVWYSFHWAASFARFLYLNRSLDPNKVSLTLFCIINVPLDCGMLNYLMRVKQLSTDLWMLTKLWALTVGIFLFSAFQQWCVECDTSYFVTRIIKQDYIVYLHTCINALHFWASLLKRWLF
jgi:hypothetical protein